MIRISKILELMNFKKKQRLNLSDISDDNILSEAIAEIDSHEVVRSISISDIEKFLPEIEQSSMEIIHDVYPFTMTGAERLASLITLGYPTDRIHFVKGKVEDTIPDYIPEQIALLRLDTDWYESTKHELEHLFPRLAFRGVLILDDYGYWKGQKKAVDEYFSTLPYSPLLQRIDSSCRLAIKA
jgi:hypothetical protein